jgi:UPF0148 protein
LVRKGASIEGIKCFSQRPFFNTSGANGHAMSGAGRERMKQAAELVSKGATMLSEPCPKCGGIQVRYHGKVFCTNHEDLSMVPASQAVSFDSVVVQMREVLLARLSQAAAALGSEPDAQKQEQLVSLMARCYELLEKLPEK